MNVVHRQWWLGYTDAESETIDVAHESDLRYERKMQLGVGDDVDFEE